MLDKILNRCYTLVIVKKWMDEVYTIKRLEPETIINSVKFSDKTIGIKTGKHYTFAVIFNNEIVNDSRGNYEIYPRKSTAQQVADNYNSKLEK